MRNKGDKLRVDYDEDLAKEICLAISVSSKSLDKICAANKHFPSSSTIYKWRALNPVFHEMFMGARYCQAFVLSDEIVDIADDDSRDYYTDEKGTDKPNAAAVARATLKVNTRKWIMSKLLQNIYGDRIKVDTEESKKEEIKKDVDLMRELAKKCLTR